MENEKMESEKRYRRIHDVQVVKNAAQPAHGKDRIRVRGSAHRSAKKNSTKGKTRGAGIHAE